MQALFASTNPFTIPGLTLKQRLLHSSSFLYYLGSLSNFFNLVAPLFYLFFGLSLLKMTVAEMLFYRLPFQAGYYLLFSWLTCRTRSALWTEFYDALLAPSMARTVVRSLCKPFGVGFQVTDKVIRRQGLSINRRVAWPFALLFLLHVLGFVAAVATQKHHEDRETFQVVTCFALSNLATLWLCLLVTLDVAQDQPFPRFAHRLPCLLLWDDTGLTGETVYLSEGDAVLKIARRALPAELPGQAFFHLPFLALDGLPARVTDWAGDGQVTIEFLELTLPQRRALIHYLYCRPGQWNRPPRNELRAMGEFLRAGLRMYPLAESTESAPCPFLHHKPGGGGRVGTDMLLTPSAAKCPLT